MKIKIAFFCIFISLFFIAACGTQIGIKPIQKCVVEKYDGTQIEFYDLCAQIEAAGRVSNFCKLQTEHNLDACYIHRVLEIGAQEGFVVEGYSAAEFEIWGNDIIKKIKAGLTYGTLRALVVAQFTKINKMAGAQILILSNSFLELPQDILIPPDDAEIAVSSIRDLVKEVNALDIWL